MKKILCTLCIAAAFVSCNLDEFPLDKLAPENYFNNEAELKTFTNTFRTSPRQAPSIPKAPTSSS